MPAFAILLKILALAPFIGCGLGALGPNRALADTMLTALIAWGALVLAFTGGMHWGLALQEADSDPQPAPGPAAPGRMRQVRIGLSALPLILGWLALLLPLVATYWLGLLLLIAAYIATLGVEHHANARITMPRNYLWLHWAFTIVAVAMLTTVLTLRLLAQTIVF